MDKNQKTLAKATTNQEGKAIFQKDWPKDIAFIEVISSMGHKREIVFDLKGNKETMPFFAKIFISLGLFGGMFMFLYFLKKKR